MYKNELEIAPEHRPYNVIDCRETNPSLEVNDCGEILSEKRELVNPCDFAPTCKQIKQRPPMGSVNPESPEFPTFVRVMEKMTNKNTEGIIPSGDTMGTIEKASYAAALEEEIKSKTE